MSKKIKTKIISLTMVSALSLSLLTGCANTESMKNSLSGYEKQSNQRLVLAASDALDQGHKQEAVKLYEKLYLKNSRNPDIAINYAKSLRKVGQQQRAVIVLSPFIYKEPIKKDRHDPRIWLEYAASNVELGNFEKTEIAVNQILENRDAQDMHAHAKNILGISKDAQGNSKEAEKLYRNALSNWDGDPAPVMNNLALSLAHQGHFDLSLNTLRQAQAISPKRIELARNIDLIEGLSNSIMTKTKN